MFNAENYVNWFRFQLPPNLNKPSIIILDNAAYHKTLPADTPHTHKMRKADVLAALYRHGVSYDARITAIEAKRILKQWQNNNIRIEIEQLATDVGHSVLFTPPHFSDLQPIEMVWARIKDAVARSYCKGIQFGEVRRKLDEQFELFETEEGQQAISNIIDSVDKVISKFLSEIAQDEEAGNEHLPSEDEFSVLSVHSCGSSTESDSDRGE